MFCPKCGVENLDERQYCRGCGHYLVPHRLAIEGRLSDATINIQAGSGLIRTGLILLGVNLLNIVINLLIMSDRSSLIFHTVVAVLITLPLILVGFARVRAAKQLLTKEEKEEAPRHALDAPPASVTERPTLEMSGPDKASKTRP
jgi:hypothetical protein